MALDSVAVDFRSSTPDFRQMTQPVVTPVAPYQSAEVTYGQGPATPGFGTAVQRGVEQIKGMGYGLAGLGADIVGAYDLESRMREGYEETQKKIAMLPRAVESYEDIDSLSTLGAYIVDLVGEQVPLLPLTLVSGGIGAIGARTVGKGLMSAAASKAIQSQTAKLVAKGVAYDVAKAKATQSILTNIGAQAGMVAGVSGMEAGSNWAQDVTTHGYGGTSPYLDLGAGIIGGMAELIGAESSLIRKITGVKVSDAVEATFKDNLKKAVMDMPDTMLKEGGVEAFQELTSSLNAGIQDGRAHLTNEDTKNIMESFVAGALLGPVFDGAGAIVSSMKSGITRGKTPDELALNAAQEAERLNLQKVYEEEQNKVDPYTLTTANENAYAAAAKQRKDAVVSEIDQTFSIYRSDLKDKYLKELEPLRANLDPTSPVGATLLPAEREKLQKKMDKLQQTYAVKFAELNKNRNETLAAQDKWYEKSLSDSDKEKRTALRKTVKERMAALGQDVTNVEELLDNEQYRRKLFEKDPFTRTEINNTVSDAETFTQRTISAINRRLQDIGAESKPYKDAQPFLSTAPQAHQEFVYDTLHKLNQEEKDLLRKKTAINMAAHDVARTAARTNDLSVISEKMNALYALASNSVDPKPVSFDIKARIKEQQEKGIKSQVDQMLAQAKLMQEQGKMSGNEALTWDAAFAKYQAQRLGTERAQLQLPQGQTQGEVVSNQLSTLEDAYLGNFQREYFADGVAKAKELERYQKAEAQMQAEEAANSEKVAYLSANREYQNSINDTPPTPSVAPYQTEQYKAQAEMVAQERQAAREQQLVQNGNSAKAAFERLTKLEQDMDFYTSLPTVQKAYTYLKNSLKSLPALAKITHICSSISDAQVPVDLQQAIAKSIFSGGKPPTGAYFNGRVYIFADRITSKEQAIRTLMHEGVGHYGLRAILTPNQFASFLAKVFMDMNGTPIWKEFERSRPAYDKANDLVRTEEFVSWLAERETPKTLLDRFPFIKDLLKMVQKVYQKLVGRPTATMTVADIQNMLALSAKNLAMDKAKKPSSGYIFTASPQLKGVETVFDTQIFDNISQIEAPFGWGLYFSNSQRMFNWFLRENNRLSGVPGETFRNFSPNDINMFMRWGTPLSAQKYVADHIKDLIPQPQMETREDGTHLTLLGKDLGVFFTQTDVDNFMKSGKHLDAISGQDVYNYHLEQTNDPKRVSELFASKGIAGTTFENPQRKGTTSYCLFNGDNLAAKPPLYADPGVRFMVEEGAPYDGVPDDYLNGMLQKFRDEELWTAKAKRILKTGVSVGPDGKTFKHNWWERAVESFYDSDRRVQIVQRMLKEQYGEDIINSQTNIYRNMTGLSNRINEKRVSFVNHMVDPITEMVKKLDIPQVNEGIAKLKAQGKKVSSYQESELKWAAVDSLLMARHALERNKVVNARIKGTKLEAPSGMTDAQAQAIIDSYSSVPGMQEVAEKFDELGRYQLDQMDYYGLAPKSLTDKLRSTYQHYVPLTGWEEFLDQLDPAAATQYRARSGISVGGKQILKKAKGREGLAKSPSTNLILQVLDTIGIGEKNEISRNLLNLVQATPESELWEVAKDRDVSGKPFFRLSESRDGSIVYTRKDHNLQGTGVEYINVIDKNGNRQIIGVHDKDLARALRNENIVSTGPIIDMIRKLTRMLAMTVTTYNPVFAVRNYPRDVSTALLNMGNVIHEAQFNDLLGSENGIRKRILRDATSLRMVKFVWKALNGKSPKTEDEHYLSQMYQDFLAGGGHTRMFEAGEFKSQYADLRKKSRQTGKLTNALQSAAKYLDMISDTSESSTRFSAYVALLEEFNAHIDKVSKEAGWSPERIAEMRATAKQRAVNESIEITVNFTRKGAYAPVFNSLWAFSSAAIGGNVRLLRNLWRRGDSFAQNAKRTAIYAAYAAANGIPLAIASRWMMGDDDDGISRYDKIPDHIKDNNMIIASPFGDGGYIKIPVPYGYNTFWVLSNAMESVLSGSAKPVDAAARVVKSVFDNFNPIGTQSGSLLEMAMPTIIRPIAQLEMNSSPFGYQIYPDSKLGSRSALPDSEKYWGTNPYWCRVLASTLNSWSGGNSVQSGFISVSPESIQHLTDSYLGGLGRVVSQVASVLTTPMTGAPVELKDVPVANVFFGSVGYNETVNAYSNIKSKITADLNEIKLAEADTQMTPQEKSQIIRENQSALRLEQKMNAVNTQLTAIRKEDKAAEKRLSGSDLQDYTKLSEKRKERLMKSINSMAVRSGYSPRAEE